MAPVCVKTAKNGRASAFQADASSEAESILKQFEQLIQEERLHELPHLILSEAVAASLFRVSTATKVKDACELLDTNVLLAQPQLLSIRATAFYTLRHYHEAYDTLRIVRKLKDGYEESPETTAQRMELEICCLMALSDLGHAQEVWNELACLFEDTAYFVNTKIMLLGAKLHFLTGNRDASFECAQRALACATNLADEISAQAALCKARFWRNGDAAAVIKDLMPLASALESDRVATKKGKKLSSAHQELRLSLAPALLAQGKFHLAAKFLGETKHPRDCVTTELHLLRALTNLFLGEFDQVTRMVKDTFSVKMRDGSSRQEQAIILWWQSLILLAIGHDREAQQRAEELYDLTFSTDACCFKPQAIYVLASCFFQRGNIQRAGSLIRSNEATLGIVPSASVTSQSIEKLHEHSSLNAFHAALQGLIILDEVGQTEAQNYLKDQRNTLFAEDALLTVALLCLSHGRLFSLLCEAFGVDVLPTGLTDMLDFAAFRDAFELAEKKLPLNEVAKLRRRFERGITHGFRPELRAQAPIEIRLFGGLEVSVGGGLLDLRAWRNNKARSLLISLALDNGRDIARETLIDRFWSQQSEKHARNSFYVTWSAMRRRLLDALPPSKDHYREALKDVFLNSGGRCALRESALTVDIREFERLFIAINTSRQKGDEDGCLQAARRLSYLYRGDLLPGDIYHEWLDAPRRRYQKQFLDAMIIAAELCLAREESELALFYLYRALGLGVEREELHHLSMRAYAQAGRREDALSVFQDCRHYMRNELGLDPSPPLQRLYEDLLRECA